MNEYIGFDLGDAESALSCLAEDRSALPEIVPIDGAGSFITAYAVTADGTLVIGEKACYQTGIRSRNLRFKSRFLTDPASAQAVRYFASGVLEQFIQNRKSGDLEDCRFYIGCPAGWSPNVREQYREIFERAGYPPLKIVSESRAALISACQSKHLQTGYDILSRTLLVIDAGSSTTDFAYIHGGHETAMQTAGEVMLGGGMMDEMLLDLCVEESPDRDRIRRVFQESPAWRHYCEFAARRLKEKYFNAQEYWQTHTCTDVIMIHYDTPLRLTLRMDQEMTDRLLNQNHSVLNGRSFKSVFMQSLHDVREKLHEGLPELVFLTGGVSRLPELRSWCMEAFPEAVIITGTEPEYSVTRGLAWSGRIDEDLRGFRADLDRMIRSTTVEDIVTAHIDDLYRKLVDALVEPVIRNAAVPVFERWRRGSIRRLDEADQELAATTERFLHSDDARKILGDVVAAWMRPVAGKLEEITMPLCISHHVPYTALSLNTYLSVSDLEFSLEAKDIFAVNEIRWMIDSIITVIVSLLCGGSGIALISGGVTGIAAGAALSLFVLALGREPMEKALLHSNVPRLLRRSIPESAFEKRIESMSETIKKNFYQNTEQAGGSEITDSLVTGISSGIEDCLLKMAQVVEIPLA